MGVFEFITALAWPSVVAFGIWTFRDQTRGMMDRILPTKLDAWGFKAEFEKRLEKVEILTKNESSEVLTSNQAALPPPEQQTFKLDLTKPPEMRILRAWNRLGKTIQRYPDGRLRTETNLRWDTSEWIDTASREIGLTADEAAALKELQALRNKVAHNVEATLSDNDATRYEEASARLAHQIMQKS